MTRIETPTKYVEVHLDNGAAVEWAETKNLDIFLLWQIPGYSAQMFESTTQDRVEGLITYLNSFENFQNQIRHFADKSIEIDLDTQEQTEGIDIGSELQEEFRDHIQNLLYGIK
ncbi:hypothetical protein LCGC14_1310530 [marine sediment metagenome]|uniref:Uncharacterized protein n=1 Tax=marine sediment metagenome TaxID=412755 RepID=A0A0F9KML7_9ZZZZ